MNLWSAWIILWTLLVCDANGQPPAHEDIVINEILFNPAKDGFDYVELYNRSQKTIDMETLLIAKRNITGDISGMKPLAKSALYLAPGQYSVITGNEKWLRQQYHVGEHALVCQVSSIPSFPDDEGNVILMRSEDSVIIDELQYSEKWHFALIADRSGIALERINYNMPAQDKNNWTSASSTSGFGTPGYENSQRKAENTAVEDIAIDPVLFSPDNDGQNDLAIIRFKMKETGCVLNLSVYDLSGRKRRSLLRNEYLGLAGQYTWDGLDDQSKPLPQGIYILVADIFNLKGYTRKSRMMITLARTK